MLDNENPYPDGYNPVSELHKAFEAVDSEIKAREDEEKFKAAHDPETQAKRAEGEAIWQKIHRLTLTELSDFSRGEIEAIEKIDDCIGAWTGDKPKLLKHIARILSVEVDIP
ncbi:hypothetical protein AGMMS49546_04500 [Spirochaetia bacterium]|nr:hypothetical protein AGMMS49546_04500 [Spirochaetia bacterium]